MKVKVITGIVLTLLLTGMLTLVSNIQPVNAEPGTITVIGPWSGPEMDAFLTVLQAFENQTGINVEYNQTYLGDLAVLLPAQFAAETTPGDVIFMWSWFITENGEEGHILEVTDFIDEANFSAGALDPVKVGCKLYGGAYTGGVKPGFWYRKSFFAANGLTVPTNWAEFTTLLDDIAAIPGIVNPIASGDGVGWPLSDITEHFLITFGGPQLHRNLTAGKVAWNSSQVRTIFADRLVPLLKGNFSYPIEWTTALDLWWDGDYGLYFMGSWITGMVDDPSDLGVFSLPGAEGLVFWADFFFIPAYTDYPEEAKQLFQFLAGAEAQTLQVGQGGHIATNLGVPLDAYPAVDRMVANLTVGKELLLDLDDTIGFTIGGEFQTTFWDQLKLLWVDPGQLDAVLAAIQAVAPSPPPPDTIPPVITVLSPENRTYTTSSVPLTFTVSECTSWIAYSLDNQANVTITGSTTLSSLSEGTHSIIIYANDTAGNMGSSNTVYFTIDVTPPTIATPTRVPTGDVMPDQPVKVSVNVTDMESGVKNVTLSYTTDNGTSWLALPMNYNSTTGLYEATIPAQPLGTWVKYKIIAFNNAENQAVNDNAGQYYLYVVIPEFPTWTSMLLMLIVLTFAIAIYKRRLNKTPIH